MRDRLPMIVSITALLVALSGITPLGEAAYNAVVPRNSVGTLQLQRNAVKAAKIAPSAVRTGHVLDGSLLTADFKAGQIPQGPKGDKGDRGPKGDKGDSGTQLTMQSVYEVEAQLTFDDNIQMSRAADCRPGDIALGADSVTFFRAGDGSWTVDIYTPNGADFERVQFHALSVNNPAILAKARCLDVTP